MDFRIFYTTVIIYAISASPTKGCVVDSESSCSYKVTCVNEVDPDIGWGRFRRDYNHNSMADSYCQFVQYGGYFINQVDLVFRQTHSDTSIPVPVTTNNWGGPNPFLNIIHSLDLSENGYDQAPTIKTMQNLVILNMSNNQLTKAVLSNSNELNMLTEIYLSYNMINDIQVDGDQLAFNRLRVIDLSHNYLVKVPDAVFDSLDNLLKLDLSYNYIDRLGQFTFEGIKMLTDLNLSNNRLEEINSSLFRFSELRILNLSGNKINSLEDNDFKHLVKLEELDLSSNVIKTIHDHTFSTMILLESLNLSNNLLEVNETNTFSSLQSLNNVDLSRNKIKSLPLGLFKNNTINEFSITDNKLTGELVEGMFEGINVTKLDLSYQYLTEVKDYSFVDLIRLDALILRSNSIKTLSNMCFKTLTKLQQLDLSYNKITNINFDKEDLTNLLSLLLKNNRITEIKHEQLHNLNSLEYLDISENQITHLEQSSFQSLRNLINLELNSNPILGTLETATFDGLILLPSLDVSHTMLTVIQNASFSNMNELKKLNLSYCDISELQYNVFDRTGYIETLDLSNNKLEDFFVNTTQLISLSTVLLNNNLIKMISSASFYNLARLTKITLSHNRIENIHDKSFISLDDIRYLDLSYNSKLTFSVAVLEKAKNLNTLILSGINTSINFANIVEDIQISDLVMTNASIGNISQLSISGMTRLDSLDLSYNNVTEVQIGDFSGIRAVRFIKLSFNKITYIQPGVFKDNPNLDSLNISHNNLASVNYGIFSGLNYLTVLDLSYNKIKDLQSERFYELKSLTRLVVDFNEIEDVNVEEFVGTSLSKLSIGNNPLPCQLLVKLQKSNVPFEITAIQKEGHTNENVNGVACNRARNANFASRSDTNHSDNAILNALQNVLFNITKLNTQDNLNDIRHLENITSILEKSNDIYNEKMTLLGNLTADGIIINNNTNIMLKKILEAIIKTTASPVTLSPVKVTNTKTSFPTTPVPVVKNKLYFNQTVDMISYVNNVRKDLEKTIVNERQNILNEIDRKFTFNHFQTESFPKSVEHEKLVSDNKESNKSLFTETCVALILIILVGLVLYKFYKSRMFMRNRFSLSTRELPGAMENSAL